MDKKPKDYFICVIILSFFIGLIFGFLLNTEGIVKVSGSSGNAAKPPLQESIKAVYCKTQIYTLESGKTLKLYCFNAISGMKQDNFDHMKELLNKLEQVKDVDNKLIGHSEAIFPFETIGLIVDASLPSYITGDPKCGAGYGSANYQEPGHGTPVTQKTIYLCESFFSLSSVEQMGILYHEANHQYQWGHQCQKAGHSADIDFNSVYGAHINFLLAYSQNSDFSCDERTQAYEGAVYENQDKMCTETHIGVPEPEC